MMNLHQLETEALALARAIHRRDAVRASEALTVLYAEMRRYGVLYEHASRLQIYFGRDATEEQVADYLVRLPYPGAEEL